MSRRAKKLEGAKELAEKAEREAANLKKRAAELSTEAEAEAVKLHMGETSEAKANKAEKAAARTKLAAEEAQKKATRKRRVVAEYEKRRGVAIETARADRLEVAMKAVEKAADGHAKAVGNVFREAKTLSEAVRVRFRGRTVTGIMSSESAASLAKAGAVHPFERDVPPPSFHSMPAFLIASRIRSISACCSLTSS